MEWFAIAAQLLTVTIRNVGLVGTELARAQDGTPRNKLFKVGAIVSIRRIHVRLSSAFPRKQLLVQALARLRLDLRFGRVLDAPNQLAKATHSADVATSEFDSNPFGSRLRARPGDAALDALGADAPG
ncbi:MAG: hypothetical protein GY811_26145, partial [Myxococcales bacterium]|nr:hypothetical protein [Myxococcales bacterium]